MNRIGSGVRWVVLATLVVGLVNAADAQDPPELRYKFAEGETLRYRVTQTATISGDAGRAGSFEMRTEQVAELAWKVESVNDTGAATIEQTVAKLRFNNASPGGEVGFDSESDEPPMGVAAMLAPAARTLLETPVTFTVSAEGEVGKIGASEELLDALGRVPGAGELLEGDPALRALVEAVLPLLPQSGKPATRTSKLASLALGGRRLATEFQPGEVEEIGVAAITLRVKVVGKAEGVKVLKSAGLARFAIAEGRLLDSESTLKIEVATDDAKGIVEQKTTVETLKKSAEPSTKPKSL